MARLVVLVLVALEPVPVQVAVLQSLLQQPQCLVGEPQDVRASAVGAGPAACQWVEHRRVSGKGHLCGLGRGSVVPK